MADLTMEEQQPVDRQVVLRMLAQKRRMKLFLSVCASCGLCASSCFLYNNRRDHTYMPSYKATRSLGRLYRARGRVSRAELEAMAGLIWGKCVMCGRCYCPFGIDISGMIAWARSICRSQGVYERYDSGPRGVLEE